MQNGLSNITHSEMKLLFTICENLSKSHEDQDAMRKTIMKDVLSLLKADSIVSYIWNRERRIFEHPVFLNMSADHIARYDTYFRFHDPITPSLRKQRRATPVHEVMAQNELEKTEFFHDFLKRSNQHYGINVFVYDGTLNIGDLRIWRTRHRSAFKKREVALLDFITPHFRNALRNIRIMTAARGMAHFWHTLLENTDIALFLFDERGVLAYRNNAAHMIEEQLSKTEYKHFFTRILSLSQKNLSKIEWGSYHLSVAPITSPMDSQPMTAVMGYQKTTEKVNKDLLMGRYRLSPREVEVCLLVCKGLTDREIATVLRIAFSTVRTHIKSIFMKVDVTNRSELISALLEGIVDFTF